MGRFKALAFILVCASFLLSALIYPYLPAVIPIHWGFYGEPNGFAGKAVGALIAPLVSLGMFLLFQMLPAIEVYRKNLLSFMPEYERMQAAFSAFFLALHAVTMAAAMEGSLINVGAAVIFLIGLLFIYLGTALPKTKRNFFVGIRTPWTLSSPKVWKKTHAFGGRVFLIMGALMAALSFFPRVPFALMMIVLLSAALAPVAYSYFVWRKAR